MNIWEFKIVIIFTSTENIKYRNNFNRICEIYICSLKTTKTLITTISVKGELNNWKDNLFMDCKTMLLKSQLPPKSIYRFN